jgi:hypothetical protein
MDNHISILLVDADPTDRILRCIDERDILATGIVVRQIDADRLGRDAGQ